LHVLSLETVESSLDSSSKNSVVKVFCRFLRLFVNCLYVWQKHEHFTVGDFMTRAGDLFVANIDTTVDEGMYVKNLEAAGLMMMVVMMPPFFPCFSAQIVQQGLNLIVTKSCWNDCL
jgi:hypothetical protein